MAEPDPKKILLDPLVDNNPIGLQVLGLCSALAVTAKLETSFVMAIAVTIVTGCSNATEVPGRHEVRASQVRKLLAGLFQTKLTPMGPW